MTQELHRAFSTPVFVYDFEGEELDKIQAIITEQMTRVRGAEHLAPWGENVGTTFDQRRNHDIESFGLEPLAMGLITAVNEYQKEIEYTGPGLRLAESWFNFFRKGGFQFEHVHPGSRVSGIYYFQTNEQDGAVRFIDPVTQVLMGSFPYDGDEPPALQIAPKVGRMILFPSWLAHRVQPNCTDHERISLSFNLI